MTKPTSGDRGSRLLRGSLWSAPAGPDSCINEYYAQFSSTLFISKQPAWWEPLKGWCLHTERHTFHTFWQLSPTTWCQWWCTENYWESVSLGSIASGNIQCEHAEGLRFHNFSFLLILTSFDSFQHLVTWMYLSGAREPFHRGVAAYQSEGFISPCPEAKQINCKNGPW